MRAQRPGSEWTKALRRLETAATLVDGLMPWLGLGLIVAALLLSLHSYLPRFNRP
jgi:hypothetical protein